jgi:capsid portal protein
MIPKPENIELEDFLRIVEKELKYLKSKDFIEIDNITHKVTVLNEFLDYYKENLEGLTYEN